jgi:hypothetical protein
MQDMAVGYGPCLPIDDGATAEFNGSTGVLILTNCPRRSAEYFSPRRAILQYSARFGTDEGAAS